MVVLVERQFVSGGEAFLVSKIRISGHELFSSCPSPSGDFALADFAVLGA